MSECTVHRHNDDPPIDAHHVWPLGMGGPDVPANIIPVCPNGHRDIHSYMRLLLTNPKPPWTERRKYGRKTRFFAEQGLRLAERLPE